MSLRWCILNRRMFITKPGGFVVSVVLGNGNWMFWPTEYYCMGTVKAKVMKLSPQKT